MAFMLICIIASLRMLLKERLMVGIETDRFYVEIAHLSMLAERILLYIKIK